MMHTVSTRLVLIFNVGKRRYKNQLWGVVEVFALRAVFSVGLCKNVIICGAGKANLLPCEGR